ncbi:MAG: DUF4062 domain-containing protein [Chitinophagaceae bacterium]|nr:DUF4062 domain-containing protein [Chitinophagaceae bacterium]
MFTEFEETRKSIYEHISERAALYTLTGMENYCPEDRRVLDKCVEDVNDTGIYICILGYKYGSEALPTNTHKEKYSFTHWEYITAKKKKEAGKRIERLIYIKETPGMKDDDERLTALKQSIKAPQDIMCRIFDDEDKLPELILKDMDNYVSRVTATTKSDELIVTCNRSVPNLLFESNFTNDPVQFYLVHCHDRDMPHYFIKRKKLDFELHEKSTLLLDLHTDRIIEETEDFTVLDDLLKASIYGKLPAGHGFANAKAVSIPGLLRMLEKMNMHYLVITWRIQSIYWKNDTFLSHIRSFYENYKSYNEQFRTERKIIFFGIAKYVDKSKITEEEFDNRVKAISYGYHLPKLTKISVGEIKDWLAETYIESNPDDADKLISTSIPDAARTEFYYSELEGALKKMIDEFNNQNI